MRASTGDELVVRGHHVGERDRRGMIAEVRGQDGGPPYLVRWADGRQSTFFPSSDTAVDHIPRPGPA